MPVVPLPQQPSLESLRKRARRLQRAVRSGDQAALALVAAHHPGGTPADPTRFALSDAQLVVARRHGFGGWPSLKRHVELLERYRWDPDPPADDSAEGPAATFCRFACLTYEDDGPQRWSRARALLAAHPDLAAADVWAASAANDAGALARMLDANPGLAVTRGGPHGWCPLFYLAYSRADPDIDSTPVLACARRLLDAGADPAEGYLWRGLPTPFTLLTGVFGHGEGGPANQPPHPHAAELARMLLAAGADANDGQALYNRMFEPDDDHLEILFEHGLGRGDGGPWKRRLGDLLDAPAEMVRGQLEWAVAHDQLARVRLLVEHGADLESRDDDGHTPLEAAALSGNTAVVEYLRERGAAPHRLAGADALLAAVMAGDRESVRRLPAAAVAALRRRPWLIVWAAARGRAAAVELLLELGFDVNAYGRGDVPGADRWQTALHTAAGDGDVTLVRLLLAAGADPDLRDARFAGTPLGWARHFGRDATIEILEPLTGPGDR